MVKQSFQQQVGDRSVTIQEIEPPAKIVKPEERISQGTLTSESIQVVASPKASEPTKLIMFSAVVSGQGRNTRSHITLWNGQQQCEAVSSCDFRLMNGFSGFRANNRNYAMLPQIVDADALGQKNTANPLPQQNGIPANGFVITKIEDGDEQSRQIMSDLHKLYRAEYANLREAYQKRKQNLLKRNPPEPEKPVTIRFWKRDMTKEQKQNEGRTK